MMGQDFENPWGLRTPKGNIKMMSNILDMSVFPGIQGGPLEHVIAGKAVAYGEALSDKYFNYIVQVRKNARAMSSAFISKGYEVISGGTDNHLMLIDLRNKNVTGKLAEAALVKAHITANKNMVPFDDKSPFITSGIRLGTAAITSRGLIENDMETIVGYFDEVIKSIENESQLGSIGEKVNFMMSDRPLFI